MTNLKRNAGLFLGGQLVSMFGSMLVQHAITSCSSMIMSCFAFGVTTFLFGTVPNFWVYPADRDRRFAVRERLCAVRVQNA